LICIYLLHFEKNTYLISSLDSLSRSPIYSHFTESLGGLSTIRAFEKQKQFQRGNEKRLDDNLSAFYSLKAVDRWLRLRKNNIFYYFLIFFLLLNL
jgi:ABC-type multidrug transport system fused ATPase/permease subunit